jgi:pyruvate formate lyase activating enzyme
MTDGTLNVLEIERFALHDGPGIRTTVFLKGCPLRCPWCANPESQKTQKQLMHFQNLCTGCGACARACPTGAASSEQGQTRFDRSRCIGCEACARACPAGAIRFSGTRMTPEAVLDEALRDRAYYEKTGGGLTVSGGEPLTQREGLETLLDLARGAGLHTAVETSGQAPAEAFESACARADLILFDLKHSDPDALRRVAGGDLKLILENLARAAASGRKVIARIPVIPGFNFDEGTLTEILRLAAERGVREAHLLPYHVLGRNKYAQLGLEYGWNAPKPLDKSELEPMTERARRLGITLKIGGK